MRFLFYFILLLASGCNHQQSPGEKHPRVFVELSSPQTTVEQLNDAKLMAVIHNNTSTDTTLALWEINNSILALEIKNEREESPPTIPPSVPPADLHAYDSLLPAGHSMTISYDLNHYQTSIPKGKYSVRMNGIPSNALIFTVTKGN